jgi:glycosyltransferase involved in cell wall biosynthesis
MHINRIFICQIVPQSQINSLPGISQAANNFCRNFILAGEFDKIYSLIPININKKILFNPENDSNITSIQFRIFPHTTLLRYVNAFIENLILVRRLLTFNKKIPIWYYNLTLYNLLSYIILNFICKRRIFFIIADYSPPITKFPGLKRLIKYLLNKNGGLITLSPKFLELNIKNIKSLAGIINHIPVIDGEINDNSSKPDCFLFSGALSSVTGLEMTLKVFSKLPDFELWITGDGPLKYLVNEYIDKYPNIKYFGFLKYNEYLKILRKVNFCINFRNPYLQENMYNFPSKFLEFLSFNLIVISTIKYEQIPDSIYMYVEFDELVIQEKIRSISKLTISDFRNNIQLLKDHLANNFGLKKWHDYINEIENFR